MKEWMAVCKRANQYALCLQSSLATECRPTTNPMALSRSNQKAIGYRSTEDNVETDQNPYHFLFLQLSQFTEEF